MKRLSLCLAWLVTGASAWTELARPSRAGDEQSDEAREIAKFVQESQRSGRERGDFKGFMAIWTADAKIIVARSEKPDIYDTALTRPQFEALARLKCRGLPAAKNVKFEFVDVCVVIAGEKAVLRYRSILNEDGVQGAAGEIFRLRKAENKWLVYENRYWPVEIRSGDETVEYTAAAWKKLDVEVERHKQDKNLLRQTTALLNAWRFQEAHASAKKLTQESKEDATAWLLRGHAAVSVADAEDAESAFQHALQIDNKASVPVYIRSRKDR